MRIDLRCVEVFMPEYFLQRADIHAVLEHQGCRRVTQLVCAVLRAVQPRFEQRFLDHAMHSLPADAISSAGKKHGVAIRRFDQFSQIEMRVDGIDCWPSR